MTARGEPHLSVTVVPDSGTGPLAGLAGLAGRMTITVAGKTHSYEFEYTLPESSQPQDKTAAGFSPALPRGSGVGCGVATPDDSEPR